ncbi:MAG TPA: DUF4942 domain-containing protein [Nevskiaceae bacterium]|nr:DUF4942 domain-containing protein [Nevskiaceae bacterium]
MPPPPVTAAGAAANDPADIGALVCHAPFFAPTDPASVKTLLDEYAVKREALTSIATIMAAPSSAAVRYFLDADQLRNNHRCTLERAELFALEPAVHALDADFWRRAIGLTDVYAVLPQPRRKTWDDAISTHTTPPFTADNVRATLEDLLVSRGKFFAERVDGVFRALSYTHVTNAPEGFGKRMILSGVISDFGYVNSARAGSIHDLRCVIARFMGRDEPSWGVTSDDLSACRKACGVWHVFDGGALRIRVYKKGTAHLEIHPDMAWRLNAILHTLYPAAIPPRHRTPPPERAKAFTLMRRPLPWNVLELLRQAHVDDTQLRWSYDATRAGVAFAEARRVLCALGGVEDANKQGMTFDYPVQDVIRELLMSGCLPDRVEHQYYPTPESLARRAVELAVIGPDDRCLEPSAGTGAIATLLPVDRTQCVEVSPLYCQVLRSKGLAVDGADFLTWAEHAGRFDRIVMNPPFSDGRAAAHVEAAARLLRDGGRLVAILPASHRGRVFGKDCACTWSDPIQNAFRDTSASVAILTLDRR